jgi:septum formation protein
MLRRVFSAVRMLRHLPHIHHGGTETRRKGRPKEASLGLRCTPVRNSTMNHVLILASASPRRQELLREAGIQFEVHPAHIPEERADREHPLDYARRLAEEKARAVASRFPGRYILGADTIVVADEHVLEKPVDHADAKRMLRMLSGRGHEVTTAVSLIRPDRRSDTRTATTRVFFRRLSDDEIGQYVAGNEPMDKAGAYAIQGGARGFADRMEGDYSNVVGLPLSLVTEMLQTNGFRF